MVVVGSIFERRAAGIYHNTAVVLDADGSLRGRYRKMHIPDDPLYYEKYYFTPGDLGFQAFDTSFARVGTLVCWDQWYPEAARLTALRGAEILFYPTAIGWHPAEKAEFGEAQAECVGDHPAVATRSPTASTSRPSTGSATKGPPAAASSSGAARSWPTRSAGSSPGPAATPRRSSSPTCDPQVQEETRRNWPFLRDRRIDAYAPITQRFLDPIMNSTPGIRPAIRAPMNGTSIPPRSATGCPPSGSRTRRPGSPGRTTATTGPASSRRSPGSTPRSSAT